MARGFASASETFSSNVFDVLDMVSTTVELNQLNSLSSFAEGLQKTDSKPLTRKSGCLGLFTSRGATVSRRAFPSKSTLLM